MRLTKRNMNKLDAFSARVLDAAVRINKREDQLRRTKRDLHTVVAKCTYRCDDTRGCVMQF